ncbi:DegV family protein [Niameybacter massiliensis]|uniref:DegV family protein n=1 Tax=Holtiella tumoricola TaxID=3018743 RepID=A0AA42DRR1_9FIRM|nr:DegV family protein [Holtiella tumoricola]MDA3733512.1 DegV family protein [Holtiella tumoricola]
MKTAIIADSNSGISAAEAKTLGVYILPMPVIIDHKTYFEGQDLTQEFFYESLLSGKEISTSQPAPGDVMALWEEVLAKGYDEIVYIPMSSGLSNSCQTALALAIEYEERVQVVDNHRISEPQRQSVLDALELAKKGLSAKEIKQNLEENAYESSIYIAVDTMEFLKKGGRVTAAAATIGTILNIKPVLTIQGDKLDAYAKVRGMKKSKHKMIEAIKEDIRTRFADAEPSELAIGIAGSALDTAIIKEWEEEIFKAFPGMASGYVPLTVSIGCHIGPNALGISVSRK